MRKSKIFVIAILFVGAIMIFTNVYADISTDFPVATGDGIKNIETGAQKVWKTVTTIFQMLAFGAIVFAGVRYMLASADQKADIKKGLVALVIGAILVFAASTVVKFVTTAAGNVLTTTQ